MQSSSFIFSSRTVQMAILRAIAIAAAILAAGAIFGGFAKIVGSYQDPVLYDFYGLEKDTVDVLCVGSSHVYCSINPAQMYEDHGIAAFNLAGGSQSVWFSYHYIKEALKTQSPEVVILDVYTVRVMDDSYFDSKAHMNLLNMKPSLNKWEALKTVDLDNRAEMFLEFPVTHSRYPTLVREDFEEGSTAFLGYYYKPRIVAYDLGEIEDVRGEKEAVPISKKAEEYIRRCIELCKEEGISLILANAPWPDITSEEQKKYNYVQEIADEYGVPFLNGCLHTEEIGLDYTVDSMGDGGHLNHTGATKYTAWLGSYLRENFGLPDRRGEERYGEWEYQSQRLQAAVRKNEMAKMTELGQYLDCLKESRDISYVVSLNGEFPRDGNPVIQLLADRGYDTGRKGTYVMNAEETVFYSDGESEYSWWDYFGNSVLHVYEKDGTQNIDWDRAGYAKVKNGINIFAYDGLLDEIVLQVGFDADKGYELVR